MDSNSIITHFNSNDTSPKPESKEKVTQDPTDSDPWSDFEDIVFDEPEKKKIKISNDDELAFNETVIKTQLSVDLIDNKVQENHSKDKQIADYDVNNNKETFTSITSTTEADGIRIEENRTLDSFMQELFSWNPEWLQGRALCKPPVIQFNEQTHLMSFKQIYNKDEYISRFLPFIQSELFIKLSAAFKSDAPLRDDEYDLFVNKSLNSGQSEVNKELICYTLRNFTRNPKPDVKVGDVVRLKLDVISNEDSKLSQKLYFGVILSHSLVEVNDLEPQIFQNFYKFHHEDDRDLLWDKYLILTKRSRDSGIAEKQMAKMLMLYNASIELQQVENLLNTEHNESRLASSLFQGSAKLYKLKIVDGNQENHFQREKLINTAISMISGKSRKSDDYCNVMAVDMSLDVDRSCLLLDIVSRYTSLNRRAKFLIVVKNNESARWWRKSLTNGRIRVRCWQIDDKRDWRNHSEIKNLTKNIGIGIVKGFCNKLRFIRPNTTEYHKLKVKKATYQRVIDSCVISSPYHHHHDERQLFPAETIVKNELLDRGYRRLLEGSNAIIGTLHEIINCQQMASEYRGEKPSFDCCIIDEAHSLLDCDVFSLTHIDIKSMIIAGDQNGGNAVCQNPIANNYKFENSLFHRIINNQQN